MCEHILEAWRKQWSIASEVETQKLLWQMMDEGKKKLREVGVQVQTISQGKPRGYRVSQGSKEGIGTRAPAALKYPLVALKEKLLWNWAYQQEGGDKSSNNRGQVVALSCYRSGGSNYHSECPDQNGS